MRRGLQRNPVLAADTHGDVALAGGSSGKPEDRADAEGSSSSSPGHWHRVLRGAVGFEERYEIAVTSRWSPSAPWTIAHPGYVQSGEPFDKAAPMASGPPPPPSSSASRELLGVMGLLLFETAAILHYSRCRTPRVT
jgi:predicted house-cleaning NTP pyrophosphatase (Maf/HAM1 superfamily)